MILKTLIAWLQKFVKETPSIEPTTLDLLHEAEEDAQWFLSMAHDSVERAKQYANDHIDQADEILHVLYNQIMALNVETSKVVVKAEQIANDHAPITALVTGETPATGGENK